MFVSNNPIWVQNYYKNCIYASFYAHFFAFTEFYSVIIKEPKTMWIANIRRREAFLIIIGVVRNNRCPCG